MRNFENKSLVLPFLPKYNILYHIYEKNFKITNITEQLIKDVLYPTLKYERFIQKT